MMTYLSLYTNLFNCSKNESAFCAPLLCADPAGAVFIAAEYVLASETQFGDKGDSVLDIFHLQRYFT